MILVTGASGFIGRHMVAGLNNLHHIDAVVHMAAVSDTTCTDWNKLIQANVRLTLQLAQDCRTQNIPFLYASSAAVYGNGAGPLNLYAESKQLVDSAMQDAPGFWYGMRFFNVWGDTGEDHKGNQASIIHRLRDGLDTIWTPDTTRDFIHVSDCVAIARWMLTSLPPSGIYDVGTGAPVSFRDLAARYGHNVNLVPDVPEHLRPHYQYNTKADLTALRTAGYLHTFRSAI